MHDKRGRESGFRVCDKLDDIFIQRRNRNVMFDARVSVEHHRQVQKEGRTTFRYDQHVERTRRLDDLLALIAPRLVVALDGKRADGLESPKMRHCVVEIVDDRLEASYILKTHV